MEYGIYSIRDSKTGYTSLTLDFNDASAMRNFEHACMQDSSLFFSHAQDYDLYKLGLFDTEVGKIIVKDVPELIVSGSSVVR